MIDVNTLQDLLVSAIWLVPVITGVTQVIITASGEFPSRFKPLLSVAIGMSITGVVYGDPTGLFAGMIFGLTASGLYDLGKKTLLGA